MSIFRVDDYTRKKEVVHKTKIPTQDKSNKIFCRNCNKQNKTSSKVCVQCDVTIREPKLRKRMK